MTISFDSEFKGGNYRIASLRLPWWFSGKETALQYRGCGFDPRSGNQDLACLE